VCPAITVSNLEADVDFTFAIYLGVLVFLGLLLFTLIKKMESMLQHVIQEQENDVRTMNPIGRAMLRAERSSDMAFAVKCLSVSYPAYAGIIGSITVLFAKSS